MPGLILTGYPSAGKTTVAQILKERAMQRPDIAEVVIINEASACPDLTQQQCYLDSLAEKKTRGALKAAFDRAIAMSNKRTLVILDSLNYIKGFRYELHCLSKAAGERHGILWVLNQASVAERWNASRPDHAKEKEAFSPSLLQELILRYEPPDERNRWDKPLYTVDVAPPSEGSDSKIEAVTKSVYNMHALGDTLGGAGGGGGVVVEPTTTTALGLSNAPTKKKPVKSAFSRAKRKQATTPPPSSATSPSLPTLSSVLASQSASHETSSAVSTTPQSPPSTTTTVMTVTTVTVTQQKEEVPKHKPLEEQLDEILNLFLSSKQLRQGNSTRQQIAGNSNALAQLDATTSRLISSIASAQTRHTGGKLQIRQGLEMTCPRTVGLPELRRLRKQYLQWANTHPPDDASEQGIAAAFVKYIEEQLK